MSREGLQEMGRPGVVHRHTADRHAQGVSEHRADMQLEARPHAEVDGKRRRFNVPSLAPSLGENCEEDFEIGGEERCGELVCVDVWRTTDGSELAEVLYQGVHISWLLCYKGFDLCCDACGTR